MCRTLAILFLILALSRPLIGGWLGGQLAGPPDTIIILLDRSASMELSDPQTHTSSRSHVLKLLNHAVQKMESSSHIVLIENVFKKAQLLPSLDDLSSLSLTQATDTSSNLSEMLKVAVDYIKESQAGETEIWIASDLQKSNWDMDSAVWQDLVSQLQSLNQDVTVRVVAPTLSKLDNISLVLNRVERSKLGGQSRLTLVLELLCQEERNRDLPIKIYHGNNSSQLERNFSGKHLTFEYQIDLDDSLSKQGGWGKVVLPTDANLRDNEVYFVYGEPIHLQTTVVAENERIGTYLKVAAAPAPELFKQSATIVPLKEEMILSLDKMALIIWQGPFPSKGVQDQLLAFVKRGGVMLCFPSLETAKGESLFDSIEWAKLESADKDTPYLVSYWDNKSGPLRRAASGSQLPVHELKVQMRRGLSGRFDNLADYNDGKVFLSRRRFGRGQVLFCTSLPDKNWSTLSDGIVLVPMVQRLLASGGRYLLKAQIGFCGQSLSSEQKGYWRSIDTKENKNFHSEAGVYQEESQSDRTIALNRPWGENDFQRLSHKELASLFAGIPFYIWQSERTSDLEGLQAEAWLPFLIIVFLSLMLESLLTMSTRMGGTGEKKGGNLKIG